MNTFSLNARVETFWRIIKNLFSKLKLGEHILTLKNLVTEYTIKEEYYDINYLLKIIELSIYVVLWFFYGDINKQFSGCGYFICESKSSTVIMNIYYYFLSISYHSMTLLIHKLK